jgi:hypothetical protein
MDDNNGICAVAAELARSAHPRKSVRPTIGLRHSRAATLGSIRIFPLCSAAIDFRNPHASLRVANTEQRLELDGIGRVHLQTHRRRAALAPASLAARPAEVENAQASVANRALRRSASRGSSRAAIAAAREAAAATAAEAADAADAADTDEAEVDGGAGAGAGADAVELPEGADTAGAVDGAPAAVPTNAAWAAIKPATAISRHATGLRKKWGARKERYPARFHAIRTPRSKDATTSIHCFVPSGARCRLRAAGCAFKPYVVPANCGYGPWRACPPSSHRTFA